MKHSEGRFSGAKKIEILWQCWQPAKARIRAVVVLAHGLGEHGGRYAHVAAALVATGCAVYAIDHRGHGRSGGRRVLIDRFAHAVKDIDQLVELALHAHPGKSLFLLGHSMGGALSLSYTLKHAGKLRGLILSCPAVSLDGAPAIMKVLSKVLSIWMPRLGLFQVDMSLLSRDPAVAEEGMKDPLNASGKVPARTLGELVKFVEKLPRQLRRIRLPLLVMHGGDDKLVSADGSRMLARRVASADKTLKVYPGLYHEIFNELPADRVVVLKDMTDWIAARA